MLAAFEVGRTPWPEWAIRMPVFILTITALYLIYKAVSNVFGRRAGFIGAMVLCSMPHWFLIGHQTMTDMPFVTAMTSSMALLLLGLHTDPERTVRTYEVDVGRTRFRFSGFHLVLGLILMVAAPQVFYLISRNLGLVLSGPGPWGFHPHLDEFFSGSAINCGLPGNQDCVKHLPFARDLQPALQAAMWILVSGVLLYLNRTERRLSRLFFLGAWFFAAVSTMGKGPAGFGLPLLCAGAYIFATGKWKKLLDIEIPSGLLIILSVAIPWYAAMYMRHGPAFTDRLIIHDMYKRAIVHVHDTNVGVDVSFRYYVWQLGYAFFPWTGLVPVGLVWWLRRRHDALTSGRGDASVFFAMWFVFAFTLFAAMLTKFHHYIFPVVPPAAMLTGILLDRLISETRIVREQGGIWTKLNYALSVGCGTVLAIYGLFCLFPGKLDGFKPEADVARPPMVAIGIPILLVGIAAVIAGIRLFGDTTRPREEEDKMRRQRLSFEEPLLGAMALGAAIVVGLVGFDLASKPTGSPPGQANLMYLFTYNYKRAWPAGLEFSGMITTFAVVAVVLMLLLVIPRIRKHVVVISLVTGMSWAAWGLDIYLVRTSPHWGQRDVVKAYYQARTGPEERLVAYQMNWKGENFYTGNRLPAFVSTGANFKSWIAKEKYKEPKVMFFIAEHARGKTLEGDLGDGVVSFHKVTDKKVNERFGIYKAVFGLAPAPIVDPSINTDEEAEGVPPPM